MTDDARLVANLPEAYYRTNLGRAYLGDALELLSLLPADSFDLIVTSPPFALQRRKEYGNVPPEEYVEWFEPFAEQFRRVLKENGSLVIHIGGSWNEGVPTKSLYHLELLLRLCSVEKHGFHLAQDFYWFNPARLPSPAEWVTVRRIRAKDAVDQIWWLSKSPYPKANNREVLKDYSRSMKDLLRKGYVPKLRPSGHDISTKFQRDHGGAIAPNLLIMGNTESNSHYLRACHQAGLKPHPARYPIGIPEFFIRFLSNEGDAVLDPFAGSNVTGEAAEKLNRSWLAFELVQHYLDGSKLRFLSDLAGESENVYPAPAPPQMRLFEKPGSGA